MTWQELERLAKEVIDTGSKALEERLRTANIEGLISRLLIAASALNAVVIEEIRLEGQARAEELQELLKAKDDFLKLTIHEIRRPLALLNGHYSMIEDGS